MQAHLAGLCTLPCSAMPGPPWPRSITPKAGPNQENLPAEKQQGSAVLGFTLQGWLTATSHGLALLLSGAFACACWSHQQLSGPQRGPAWSKLLMRVRPCDLCQACPPLRRCHHLSWPAVSVLSHLVSGQQRVHQNPGGHQHVCSVSLSVLASKT